MEKFYNNPAWRRIRGLRSFGILALSVAFCLTGLLALSSCDLEFWEDDDEDDPEPTVMRGFYISIDCEQRDADDICVPDNTMGGPTDCTNELLDTFTEGDLAAGRTNFRAVASGADFESASFLLVGIKVDESDTNPEAIVASYN